MNSSKFKDSYKFSVFPIKNIQFPCLFFGTSPFFGAGQFKERSLVYYQKFYLNPQNMTTLYSTSISKGLNAIHVPSDPVIIDAIDKAIRSSGITNFVLVTIEVQNLDKELELCKKIEADSIIIHGSFTDRRIHRLCEILKEIKERFGDIPTGIATHSPGDVILKVLDFKEVELILAPLNLKGKFMLPNMSSSLNAITKARRRGKKIIAMKTLAAGLLTPCEAFDFIRNKVDGLAVGVTSEKELDEVIRCGSKYFL